MTTGSIPTTCNIRLEAEQRPADWPYPRVLRIYLVYAPG